MSVPLPSPSPLPTPTAKPIPRSRPQPISLTNSQQSPSFGRSPARRAQSPGTSPGSPGRSGSLRTRPAKSVGFGTSSGGANEDNWRERTVVGPKSAVRTVGGFEKKPIPPSATGSSPLTSGLESANADKDKDKDKEGEKAAALSHVPCRFFKAGACTAGSACPFSHEEGGKREVCQWFLKGNCKFAHKCALAHVRPGEPMSMDRKNKKAAQLEARDKDGGPTPAPVPISGPRENGLKAEAFAPREIRSAFRPEGASPADAAATPVPIRSALSSSIQSPPVHRIGSSPFREPIGPPPSGPTGGTSPGFARSPIPPSAFASSPSRPSPLSSSFSARPSVPGSLSLKSNVHSPLRPPTTAFSSSFSHSSIRDVRAGTSPAPPLSASFADGPGKNIWARNETPLDRPDMLSPRRPIGQLPRRSHENVFETEEEEEHGEDLLPSSLSDLLTPRERARRMSRRDSNESFSASPSRAGLIWSGGERLAQSAGPTMGPGFLQGLWSADGEDARKAADAGANGNGDFAFGPGTAQPQPRQSLLTQQRSPISPQGATHQEADVGPSYPYRALGDPSSPGTKALQEHAPGQSLPGGLATALSRLHLRGPRTSSGLVHATAEDDEGVQAPRKGEPVQQQDHEEEGLFAMDG